MKKKTERESVYPTGLSWPDNRQAQRAWCNSQTRNKKKKLRRVYHFILQATNMTT